MALRHPGGGDRLRYSCNRNVGARNAEPDEATGQVKPGGRVEMGVVGVKRNRRSNERGASLVEFAIMAPLLILLLLGIVEFGWGIAQQLDLRHKAREVLRLAVVDATDAEIVSRVCSDDIISRDAILRIESGALGTDPGDTAAVIIEADLTQITGLFSWAWGGAVTLESEVFGRIEQPTTNFTPGESLTCPS